MLKYIVLFKFRDPEECLPTVVEKLHGMMGRIPEILSMEGLVAGEEGCLSVPGYFGTVERPEKVRLRAQDRNGEFYEIEAEGLKAVAICHEYDHLEGVLFTDKASGIREAGEE